MNIAVSVVMMVSCLAIEPQQRPVSLQSANDHFKSGMQALAAEQHDKAEAEFRVAVDIDPLYDAAFYGLGQVYMATKRYEQAVRAYLDSRKAFNDAVAAESSTPRRSTAGSAIGCRPCGSTVARCNGVRRHKRKGSRQRSSATRKKSARPNRC